MYALLRALSINVYLGEAWLQIFREIIRRRGVGGTQLGGSKSLFSFVSNFFSRFLSPFGCRHYLGILLGTYKLLNKFRRGNIFQFVFRAYQAAVQENDNNG